VTLCSAARVVITRPMHTSIFAIVAEATTFACTRYGLTVQGVMNSLGLEPYVLSYPDLDELRGRRRFDTEHWFTT
jgi:hypothetical protein